MTKINPLLYITNWTPVSQSVLNASGWFENETTTVRILAGSEESLGWFLAQGWTVTSSTREKTLLRTSVYSSSNVIAYDYVYAMTRRKLQSDRVLQSMINEFTKAYNEGRRLNDRRYDEIITLQSVMLDDTENEFVTVNASVAAYEAIVDRVIADLPADFATYKSEVEGIFDTWGDSQRERVNTQFDNQLAKARADLISRGMYNGTVWTSVASGIEESRATALNELEDRVVDKRFSVVDKINSVRSDFRSRLEASALRLSDEKQKRVIGQLEFRNAIITALAAFMERRTDDYPGIAELAKLAAGLGYSEGGTVRA
jgi:DNA-binding ferritin-like protein (Dps family)